MKDQEGIKLPHEEDPFEDIEAVLGAVAHALTAKGHPEYARLIAEADIKLEYREHDNWDGGTSVWDLVVRIPYPRFAAYSENEIKWLQEFIDHVVGPFLPECGHWVHAKLRPKRFEDHNWREKILAANTASRRITEVTRRALFDTMIVKKVNWAGSLNEQEFLARLYDLQNMPSSDKRFPHASGDIWQHRINNYDWDDHWVFYDTRFNLLRGDDGELLKFLAETLHPAVRPDVAEARRLVELYNLHLKNDGFQMAEESRVSGKPVYAGRDTGIAKSPGIEAARTTWGGTDVAYVTQQIARMEAAVWSDPWLAIGTAKEFVETCCKTILSERKVGFSGTKTLPQLVKLTAKELRLTPEDIPDRAKAAESIRRLLSNLATITDGIAQLRNSYGTGHGRQAKAKGLGPRHAKLAVGAASTLGVFLAETHREAKDDTD